MKAEFQNPLMKGLACAALDSGLRSILVFDASPATLQTMAGLLAQMAAVGAGGEVVLPQATDTKVTGQIVPVQLGTVETEEDLWGSLALGQNGTSQSVVWKAGLLAVRTEQETRIVVIPDLSRLSLAASRACVMLMGADVAHLERHGQRDRWPPQLFWLAGCDRTRIGTLSPHLLDRFALRLSGGESPNSHQRVTQLRSWFEQFDQKHSPGNGEVEAAPLSAQVVEGLNQAQQIQPEVLPEARERVLEYVGVSGGYSPRRDLALLRLARAQARLTGTAQVGEQAVDGAAALIGLTLQRSQPEMPPSDSTATDLDEKDDVPQSLSQGSERENTQPSPDGAPSVTEAPVFESDTQETLPSTALPMGGPAIDPYLEDTVAIEREAASLRLPPRRFKAASLGRGAIIGVEPTPVPQDLALVSTLLEAAKYQALRWQALKKKPNPPQWAKNLLDKRQANGHVPLILQAGDLRRYRRAAVPEQMLTLVLDYTSLKECQWQGALLPYLQWAYVERASVCLIQVGAADAEDELRAEKREADNILVPRIRNRLEVAWGSSNTPWPMG
ncbi:MAG: hypothetical protein HC929_09695 [Leptolyngbyaceae cyanobacterium SM2_5_2]|nr:hypothetical protein [Leptolyngbyaceae cyanobacterium SM2_5_2]